MARIVTSLLLAMACGLCELQVALCARLLVDESSSNLTVEEALDSPGKKEAQDATNAAKEKSSDGPASAGSEKADSATKKGTGKKASAEKKKMEEPVAEEFEAGEWDIALSGWTKDQGCFATAMALQDGAWFAAAPVETKGGKTISKGWHHFLSGDHDEAIMQEDGTTKKVKINEASSLAAVLHRRDAPNGLWIKGTKYSVMHHEPKYAGTTMTWVMGLSKGKPGKASVEATGTGVQILQSEQFIFAGLFDQALRQGGNCLTSLKTYADELRQASA